MVYVPSLNTLQVEIRGTSFGKEVENVLYFQSTGAITPANVSTLFTYLTTTWIPQFQPYWHTSMQVDELYGTDLSTASSPTYPLVVSPAIVGTSASPGLPNSVTPAISFRTNNRGRSSRGRNYVPGMVEAAATGDTFGASTINGLVALYELLMGGGAFPAGWDWVVVSRILNGLPRVAALVQSIIDVASTSLEVDSQRKRVQ